MLHEEITKDIIGAAMAVLNELKPGLDEKLYENALVIDLQARGHTVEQQREYPVHYRDQFIGKLIPDLIVDLIDKEQWSSLSAEDVKGDAYEGLLQKNAEDVKGGAGQYFTPRPLIAAMVDVVAPACYNQKNRNARKESERFKSFSYDELTKRDKLNVDIFWLKDDALEESANLPSPEIIAADITADLEAALEQFATIAEDLK